MIRDDLARSQLGCRCKWDLLLIPRRPHHAFFLVFNMTGSALHHETDAVDQANPHLHTVPKRELCRLFRDKFRFRCHDRFPRRRLGKFIPGALAGMDIFQPRKDEKFHKALNKGRFPCPNRTNHPNIDLAAGSRLDIAVYIKMIHKNTPLVC